MIEPMHGSATTTPEIRRAIQKSGRSIRYLAAQYGVNPKTIAKWKARDTVTDMPMGPRQARRKALSPTEEAACIAFRIQAMLPLDDCLYALQLMFPHLTRSNLHRLFQRQGIQRLPNAPARRFVSPADLRGPEIGHFYIGAADIRTGTGRANMFFSFDRTSKIAFAWLYDYAHPANGPDFLDALVAAVPYNVRSVLTGPSSQFTGQSTQDNDTAARDTDHPFEMACRNRQIHHELLAPDRSWSIDRIDTAQAQNRGNPRPEPGYESHDELREHFLAFFETYNFERRLKTLRGLTPFEFVCQCWADNPDEFRHDPHSYGRMLNG